MVTSAMCVPYPKPSNKQANEYTHKHTYTYVCACACIYVCIWNQHSITYFILKYELTDGVTVLHTTNRQINVTIDNGQKNWSTKMNSNQQHTQCRGRMYSNLNPHLERLILIHSQLKRSVTKAWLKGNTNSKMEE